MAASSTSFLIRTRVSAAAIRVRCREDWRGNADKVLIDDAGDGNAALPDAAHAILESGPVDAY